MGVQLNIKDTVSYEIASDLSRALGKSRTVIVREALQEKKERREQEIAARIKSVNEFVDEFRRKLTPEQRALTSKEIMDSIYDDNEPDGFAR